MQFGGQPSLAVGYPNAFIPDRRPYGGMSGPPLPPHLMHAPYYPPWNGVPVPGSPPGAFRPTLDGWYTHPPPPGIYPPGSFPAPTTTPSQPILPPDNWVHDFWKGRFAPFPGTTSPPSLLKKTPSRGVPITAPRDAQSQSPSQSHPPHASNVIFETHTKLLPPLYSTSKENNKEKTGKGKETQKEMETENGKKTLEPEAPLDKYAEIFVPQYLQDIQNQPHALRILPPIPPFPGLEYLQRFLPSTIIDVSTAQRSSILSNPPPATAPSLTASYHQHWNALLSWELHKLAVEKEQIVLWKTGIKVGVWDGAEFLLFVPGIRENTPRLEIGDILVLREVFEARKMGSGIAFEGRVVALRKREGLIHFYCPTLKLHIQTFVGPLDPTRHVHNGNVVFTPDDVLPLLFNISFVPTARPSFLMDVAARTFHDAMAEPFDTNRRRSARRWLFPVLDDLREPSMDMIQRHLPDECWTDTGLNKEQKLAVSSIVLHESPIPFLINGPPGTGKTRTTVEAVLQILRFHPQASIILCAPSNPATDTLVLRLRTALQPHEMLRLNDPNRTFAEVPLNIRQYCYVENDKYALPPWDILLRYRVVVCSCLDAGILVDAHCTNNALARLEAEIIGSLHPRRQVKEPIMPHWTHLLIDEAAQAAEPELLIPMSVVLPGTEGDLSSTPSTGLAFGSIRPSVTPQLVLCGDPNQLGPTITSDAARDAELDVSLLQRLFDHPVYADYPQTVSALNFKPYINLVKNYRSHPAILMPPSALFYDDSLVPCAVNGTITWSGLPNPRLPLLFIGSESTEECVDERASWYNTGEIKCTVDTIVSLLADKASSSPPLQASEIGVMSAFREQVWKIREHLRKEGLSAVDVGTVEDYQGREMRVCIISCVRSSTRFLKDDLSRGLGLVYERKRLNVAITRAKELLVVIGNATILQQDPFWRSFLQFTLRNKLYSGPPLHLELDGNYISRLESELVVDLDEEDRGVAMAGGIAREILRE
ncbi:P-loop containing nucleoside triphosphate hydrolase protein [Mycena alexandri]|uniref:P-loop containing nucleoside triphosphate hydrolase protein n=1 Tax=Mycena alexandri TaxID=1745969 RepID=A0AAD6TF38_9AGAR|nr:P-loop containing nucleoside triphosphate hydrolase protein [Mycena alexandri]